jgi:hypothetical protein
MISFIRRLLGITQLSEKVLALTELELENKRNSEEIVWAQVFNSAITDSKWLRHQSFNPGRWAAGYPMLYILYRIYNDIKPKQILEFGLGESTKLAYQYKASQTQAGLDIIEQDENWLNFFSSEIYDVRPNTVLLPLVKQTIQGFETNVYGNLLQALPSPLYNLIVIDGPWGSERYSRYQIVEIVENNKLAADFVILLDDYNRIGEQDTAQHLREALKRKGIAFNEGVYAGAKQTLLLCSPNYAFLTSL